MTKCPAQLSRKPRVYTYMPQVPQKWFAAALSLAMAAPAFAAKKEAPPVQAATAYVSHETHEKEHVTVAAEPFDTREKGNFFRVDYSGHSILPIRLIIANDSDSPLDLNQVRIQLIASDGTKLPAATPEELNRRLFRFNDIKQKRIPGTPITYRPTPVDKKILDDDKDFSFTQTTIPAHSSANGFLFYDIRDLDDPPLRGTELYVKMMHTKQDGKDAELFAFSVNFDKYLDQEKTKRDAAKAAAAKAAEAKDSKDSKDKDDKDFKVDTTNSKPQ
ncbi:hypothetical protein [Terriglobus sp. TAA 43]|uniref:hypothetical protein n=1 Tax=Terriglobus sp. TAA 43 TaxID=278961 RepID=UPI001E370F0C|nr:hypothetical protein [Terriglobus sp. TAA 43]